MSAALCDIGDIGVLGQIFRGLRVRMGAHWDADGACGCDNVSQLPNTELLKTTRKISDVAIGEQIAVSNPRIDVAALGCVEETTISMIQLLPPHLRLRLPEFVPMYVEDEKQIRPPCGKITCVFTGCSDLKALSGETAARESERIDNLITEVAESQLGYICKVVHA